MPASQIVCVVQEYHQNIFLFYDFMMPLLILSSNSRYQFFSTATIVKKNLVMLIDFEVLVTEAKNTL